MFISSFFSFIGTVLLWFLGIAAAIFVLPIIYRALKAAFSAFKSRKRRIKQPKRCNDYFKQYRSEEKNSISNYSTTDTANLTQYNYNDNYKKHANKTEHKIEEEIEFLHSLSKDTVNSTNTAANTYKDSISVSNADEVDYEKHKNDSYYKLKSYIMSPGESVLLGFLEKIIDPSMYVIVPQVHYDRYLEVNKDRDEKYQAISASKINTRSTDFGIETKDHRPVCYVEYNDNSHKSENRKKRDYFLMKACQKAGLPHIVITSDEVNSQAIEMNGTMKICKIIYKKLYNAQGNPLNLPSLLCPKCGKEFKLLTGDYGAFLSHGRNSECENINIFRK